MGYPNPFHSKKLEICAHELQLNLCRYKCYQNETIVEPYRELPHLCQHSQPTYQ